MTPQNKYDLRLIREKLPYGSYETLEKRSGYSDTTISNLLNGKIAINKKNEKIIKEALKLIIEDQKQTDSIQSLQESIK